MRNKNCNYSVLVSVRISFEKRQGAKNTIHMKVGIGALLNQKKGTLIISELNYFRVCEKIECIFPV